MNILKGKDQAQVSRIAAGLIAAQVQKKPTTLLGLATGSSPVGTYQALIDLYQAGDVDFSAVRSVNLDEYVGLNPALPQSYLQFMKDHFFDHININPDNYHLPNGLATDLSAECTRYDQLITQLGGIDLQLLGIGHDGHIGFNEPHDTFSHRTNCVQLTEMTIEANTRFFDSAEQVPRSALTMGIADIMAAESIVMVVQGADKADILHKAIYGPVTPQVPASILQYHKNCTIVADAAALDQ